MERPLALLGGSAEAEQAALESKKSISHDWWRRSPQVTPGRESSRHRLFPLALRFQKEGCLEVAEPRELASSVCPSPQDPFVEGHRVHDRAHLSPGPQERTSDKPRRSRDAPRGPLPWRWPAPRQIKPRLVGYCPTQASSSPREPRPLTFQIG